MSKEEMTLIDFSLSLQVAVSDYIARHHGEKPAKIVMSREVAAVMTSDSMFEFRVFPEKYAGIPVRIVDEKDDFICLCEPEITLYQKRAEKIPK